jgi:HEAT repeat protein
MTAALLEIALKDSSYSIRGAAASNSNMTIPLLELALKDPDSWVRRAAADKLARGHS